MKAQVVLEAFLNVRQGFSVDRVIADPELNEKFQQECVRLRSTGTPRECNQSLLNLRKASRLTGLPRSKRTSFPEEDEYRFASELAVRFLERRDQLPLDQILCDLALASEFDELAMSLVPGYSQLQYRWAALNLRKARKLPPELGTKLIERVKVIRIRCTDIELSKLPRAQGLYLFLTAEEVKYVGETSNLQKRISKHLDHSDNREFARWLWDVGDADLILEYQILPAETSVTIRKGLEAELIRNHRPIFNVQRK